jgi:DNA-binding GntR family transcriptional regulator
MDNQSLRRIQPRTLSQQIAEMLRNAILNGEILPGERLNEKAIATETGTSRMPVREALRQLEQQGLVISIPNRGSFARYYDQKDIAEIYELRAVLEGLACRKIAEDQRLTSEDFDLLQGYVEDQLKAFANRDYDAWVESEIRFHTFLLQKAESQRLLRFWRNLHVQCLFATRDQWGVLFRRARGHPIILDALHKGKREGYIELHEELYDRYIRLHTEEVGETASSRSQTDGPSAA